MDIGIDYPCGLLFFLVYICMPGLIMIIRFLSILTFNAHVLYEVDVHEDGDLRSFCQTLTPLSFSIALIPLRRDLLDRYN